MRSNKLPPPYDKGHRLPPPYDIIEDNEIDSMMHRADSHHMPFTPQARLWLICARMAVLTAIILLIGIIASHAAHANNVPPMTRSNVIDACIGESEGETYLGKVMLIYTIFNRGSFKGVYGVYSRRVIAHKYAQVTYNQCAKAYDFAKANPNPDWKARGWGNESDIAIFKKYKWWKNCQIIAHVGRHFFYMERS